MSGSPWKYMSRPYLCGMLLFLLSNAIIEFFPQLVEVNLQALLQFPDLAVSAVCHLGRIHSCIDLLCSQTPATSGKGIMDTVAAQVMPNHPPYSATSLHEQGFQYPTERGHAMPCKATEVCDSPVPVSGWGSTWLTQVYFSVGSTPVCGNSRPPKCHLTQGSSLHYFIPFLLWDFPRAHFPLATLAAPLWEEDQVSLQQLLPALASLPLQLFQLLFLLF